MRIARTLFVSAAITASAALCAPAANAVTATEPWTPVNATSFGSDDHDKFKDGKEKFKDEHGKKDHFGKEKPKGGVHAGGGALAMTVTEDGGHFDDERDKFKDGKEKFKDEHDKKDHFGKEKPKGGVHAGGGGLATSGGSMTAGSVLLLGGLGAGAYMLRRRNASDAAA
jgi:hypothetical protein